MPVLVIIIFFIAVIFSLILYILRIKKRLGKNLKLLENDLESLKHFQDEHIELEAILQAIQDGVIITGLDKRIKLTSWKAATILRTDILTLKEQNIENFFPVADLKDKFNVNLTTELKLQNGETITAEIKSLPIISQEKIKGTVYIIHDKTQEKIFEEMKLDFVAMAAHQLRTPLTSLKGYLFLLSQTIINKLTEQEKLYMQRSLAGVDKLSSLIEYLINATRIGDNKLNLNLKLSSLEHVISRVITEFENIASQKGINISFEKPETPLPEVMIDPYLIETVLDNLTVNAIEHSQSVKISIRAKKYEEELIVSVQDYGKGIPGYALDYLFTKFYKVPSHLLATPGNGLGLYISRLIIEAHHGKIWVDSILGRGSTFSFSLPLVKKPEQG